MTKKISKVILGMVVILAAVDVLPPLLFIFKMN